MLMNSVDLFSGLGATALALGSKLGDAIAHPRVFCGICGFSRKLLAERAGQDYFGPTSNEIRICDDVATLVPHPNDGVIDLVTGTRSILSGSMIVLSTPRRLRGPTPTRAVRPLEREY